MGNGEGACLPLCLYEWENYIWWSVWRNIDLKSLKIRTNVESAHFKGKY